MCTLAGFGILGLLRLGELAPEGPLQLLNANGQLTVSKTGAELLLLESKTDYFRKGVCVPYPRREKSPLSLLGGGMS